MAPTPAPRLKLIALEEHFVLSDIVATHGEADRAVLSPSRFPGVDEVGEIRLRLMDEAGIDVQVLSHAKPGVQDMADVERAHSLSIMANDFLAQTVKAHPDRFAGFATLATAAPQQAARELERTVREHGFKGAMINGHTRGRYLDDPFFWGIFEAAEALDVPIYLHPASPHPAVYDAYFKDHPALSHAAWGYGIENGTHVLKLILGGVFDRFPRLKIIIGHMGELLPFALWRVNSRLKPAYPHLKRSIREYFLDHFSITTSGVFSTPELMCTASVVGFDNILFSVDYPFESNLEAVRWFETAPIADVDRAKVAHLNAQRLLKL
ncbi:MAG: amidohydrolase family protein [Burkholderiaceae bacterium]